MTSRYSTIACKNGRRPVIRVDSSSEIPLSDMDQIIDDDRLLIRVNYDGDIWLMIDRILGVRGGKLK